MKLRSNRGMAAAMALLASAWAQAQTAPVVNASAERVRVATAESPRPNPLDARAPVRAIEHRSVLGTYRGGGDAAVGSWRDANDAVNRIGGWRAYAREAAADGAPGHDGHAAPRKP